MAVVGASSYRCSASCCGVVDRPYELQGLNTTDQQHGSEERYGKTGHFVPLKVPMEIGMMIPKEHTYYGDFVRPKTSGPSMSAITR